jgi:hypothetical protein
MVKGKSNPVAKFSKQFNKGGPMRDRKKDDKRGYQKHKKQYKEDDQQTDTTGHSNSAAKRPQNYTDPVTGKTKTRLVPVHKDVQNEKLDPSMGVKKYIDDFQKSDAPQFQGKSKEKRKEMAIAAYLDAKRGTRRKNSMTESEIHVRLDHLDGDSRQKKAGAVMRKHERAGHIEYVGNTDKGVVFKAKSKSHADRLHKELKPHATGVEHMSEAVDNSHLLKQLGKGIPKPTNSGTPRRSSDKNMSPAQKARKAARIKKALDREKKKDKPGMTKRSDDYKRKQYASGKSGEYFSRLTKKEACWTGYRQAGMKKKGDKVVPNCVPESTDAYGKSQAAIRLKKQKAAMTPSDRDKMSKVADMMRREREKRASQQNETPEKKARLALKHTREKEALVTKHKREKDAMREALSPADQAKLRNLKRRVKQGDKTAKKQLDTFQKSKAKDIAVSKSSAAKIGAVRPKANKAMSTGSGGENSHIVMQLRKAQDVGGNMELKVSPTGKRVRLSKGQIDSLLKRHDSMSKPRDKRMFRVQLIKKLRGMAK